MHLKFNDVRGGVKWSETKPGQVYADALDPKGLVALCTEDQHALCLREGCGVKQFHIWKPGPDSNWVHCPNTTLTVG